MDIFKDKGSHTQGGTEHINKPTTHEERAHQHGAPFLFACSPKGKRKQQQRHKNKQDKTREQAKDNQNKADKMKDKKQEQRDKTKGKRR